MASQARFAGYSRSREPSRLALKVEGLLKRYPNLSEEELATLIEGFPRVPILDAAVMAADYDLSGQVEAFHREHGPKLQRTLPSAVAFLAFPTLLLIGLAWWALS